jgi:predicted nucleic acid-binding protein
MVRAKEVIVDASYVVALFNENDAQHQAAAELEQKLGDEYQFISTVFVFQEICWLLLKKAGHHKMLGFMGWVYEGLMLLPALPDCWLEKSIPILQKYSDRKLDLADASICVLATHLNLGDIASLDFKDFSVLRWGNGKQPFNNFMVP